LKDLIPEVSGPYFAIAPGSIWPTKRWPAEYYKAVTKRLAATGFHTLLIGSRDDKAVSEKISANLKQCTVLTGQLSLRQTFYLLQSCCRGILSNDSAPMHLGLAASIPVFGVFGATVPEFGFAPVGENGYIFENRDILCRPCGIHGGAKCPVKTFACMEQINPQQVAEFIINNIISGSFK
jgi:heptosyltransferase-2